MNKDIDPMEVEYALTKLDSYEYHDWVMIGIALQKESPDLFEVWHRWSKRGPNYISREDCLNHWSNFDSCWIGELTIGIIFRKAKEPAPLVEDTPEIEQVDDPSGEKLFEEMIVSQYDPPPQGYGLAEHPELSKHLRGILPGLYLIGSAPSVGKTAFQLSLVKSLLRGDRWQDNKKQSNDCRVCFLSLDDSRKIITARLVSCFSGVNTFEAQYPTWNEDTGEYEKKVDPERLAALQKTNSELLGYIDEGRLFITDTGITPTWGHIKTYIEKHVEDHPNTLFFLDGILNVANAGSNGEPVNLRQTANYYASELKYLVTKNDIAIFTNVELRKASSGKSETDTRPTMADFRESGQWAYVASCVFLMAPYIGRWEKTGEVNERNKDIIAPVFSDDEVFLRIAKNKITGRTGPWKTVDLDGKKCHVGDYTDKNQGHKKRNKYTSTEAVNDNEAAFRKKRNKYTSTEDDF